MSESFVSRLTKTLTSSLQPGDRGIGIVDMGDGQPFVVAVTVEAVEQDVAVVRDTSGRLFKARGLLAVREDAEVLLEAKAAAEAYEETRRARYVRPWSWFPGPPWPRVRA